LENIFVLLLSVCKLESGKLWVRIRPPIENRNHMFRWSEIVCASPQEGAMHLNSNASAKGGAASISIYTSSSAYNIK